MEDSQPYMRHADPGWNEGRQRPKHLAATHNGKPTASGAGVAHTLTACCRCRTRKTRCDVGLPRCGPCERSNAVCEYLDAIRGKKINRAYVVHLQNKVQALEAELAQMSLAPSGPPDSEAMARSAGYVRFKGRDDPRYLGPSSGIAITRMVMEIAKRKTDAKNIREIIPPTKAFQIKDHFSQEDKPTSKVYPLISDVAAPYLPTRELTDSLVDNFNRKAQFLVPTLHEPTFRKVVQDVYQGSMNPYKNFTLRMVLAISMQKLDTQYAGLADSYYLAALPFLGGAIKPMDLGTLQCFALMAQYSLVTPTRTAAYWIVGMASRLSQELGLNEEATIAPVHVYGPQYNPLEIDMRRRLFWIIAQMEFGLAHSLGRPSCGPAFDHIDVAFFEAVDDQYITASGIVPECPESPKKRISIHFLKMRLCQAEIRRKLYLKKRPEPTTDKDPWFLYMDAKLKDWLYSSPKNDDGSGLSEIWFKTRYNTIVVFLYRPSPQVPEPSIEAARRCFEAAVFNIQAQRDQIAERTLDVTWIFTQSLFMALNTLLWSLSYVEIREEHPKDEVEKYITTAQTGIFLTSYHWPGVQSALEVYEHLISACIRAYDSNKDHSDLTGTISDRESPASLQELVTPPPLDSPFRIPSSQHSPRHFHLAPRSSPNNHTIDQEQQLLRKPSPVSSDYSHSDSYISSSLPSMASLDFPYTPGYENTSFDPLSIHNSFPPLHPRIGHIYPNDQDFTLESVPIGEQYSQYLHAPYTQYPLQSLSQEGQIKLMRNLENAGLKG